MSAFEKLPREIRNLIYEHCLLYEGEIIPFPRDYERVGLDRHPEMTDAIEYRKSCGLNLRRVRRGAPFVGYPRVKRDCWQTERKPCVALLGVNSTVREEAATVLFGKNIWRLSSMSHVQDDRYLLWKTFASYFQYIVARFDVRDSDETKLLALKKWRTVMKMTARYEDHTEVAEDSNHFDLTGSLGIPKEEVRLLKDDFIARWDVLRQMKLKSLALDFDRLCCTHGCCGHDTLRSCLVWLASFGPRYRLEQVDKIKVFGLKDEKENKLFWEAFGGKTS